MSHQLKPIAKEGKLGDEMADIHNDIERRLIELSNERMRLQSRLSIISEIERELKALLARQRELIRIPKVGANGSPPSITPSQIIQEISPVATAILRLLDRGPTGKERLSELLETERFAFGDKSPARVIHLTLLNLQKQGLVESMPTGEWKLRNPEKTA